MKRDGFGTISLEKYYSEKLKNENKTKKINEEMDMLSLEEEITKVEEEALEEEKINVNKNYSSLKKEYDVIKSELPYPDTFPEDKGCDYDDIEAIQYKKSCNRMYWEKMDAIRYYFDSKRLFSGHVALGNSNYFILNDRQLRSKYIKVDGKEICLVNEDDENYKAIIKAWRYPGDYDKVMLSRNIDMHDKKVVSVDVVIDRGTTAFADITDAYLRKAIIRNKDRENIEEQYIPIQKLQDNIRLLPKEDSFIVQGCAGSGKTMILFYRLRYLIYNKKIDGSEYYLLVPNSGFRTFISGMTKKFGISQSNILSYQEYYRKIVNKSDFDSEYDLDELVFEKEYLEKIYSLDFIKYNYGKLFDELINQTNQFINLSDICLNGLLEKEEKEILIEVNKIVDEVYANFVNMTASFSENFTIKIEKNLNVLSDFLIDIKDKYENKKKEYKELKITTDEIVVSEDDFRITSDEEYIAIINEIEVEEDAINRASFFTKNAHKRKLDALYIRFNEVKENIINSIREEEKKKKIEEFSTNSMIFGNYKLSEIEIIIVDLEKMLEAANIKISELKEKRINIDKYLEEKYSSIIEQINEIINLSSNIDKEKDKYVNSITPSYTFFESYINRCCSFYAQIINMNIVDEELSKEFDKLKIFTQKSTNQIYSYIGSLLFNKCKKTIKDKYEIKICDRYKHYWYIYAYCNYLTRPLNEKRRYIYIDEAQDLSLAEIELIFKINKLEDSFEHPIINIFGDIGQVITRHGIREWSCLNFTKFDLYNLDQNFRNSNEIIDYCNNNISTKMQKLGINLEDVSEYSNISEAMSVIKTIGKPIFIVKDEYEVENLKQYFKENRIDNYLVYSVKKVKGLEFKRIFVIDKNMSINEKYIAYTRALTKIDIIKDYPEISVKKSLIIQGEE